MTDFWQIRTIAFDLDDTLYPERDFVFSGFQAVDDWLKATYRVEGFAAVAENLFTMGRRGKVFDEALPLIGIEPAPNLVGRLVEIYRAHKPKLRLFSDAAEALDWIAPRFCLALITDGRAGVQRRKIQALGLESVISCRVITDELGREHWKPSPEPYRRVMACYGGNPANYVYIGDNPLKDFLGAKSMGWRTVWVRRPEGEYNTAEFPSGQGADREIGNLAELTNFIKIL